MIINASYEVIWFDFERKNYSTLVFLLKNCPKLLKMSYDSPVKYYFWWFRYM